MARILLVTDAGLSRLGFSALADRAESVQACPAVNASHVAGSASFDLIVVEDTPAVGDVVSLCAVLAEQQPDTPVLLLTAKLHDGVVRAAIECGVRGIVGRDESPERLRWAIDWLLQGQAVLDPRVAASLLGWLCEIRHEDEEEILSRREVEVLKMVGSGESNKRIARQIGVAENTVRTYLQRSYRKLGCHTRSSAAAEAIKRGWI